MPTSHKWRFIAIFAVHLHSRRSLGPVGGKTLVRSTAAWWIPRVPSSPKLLSKFVTRSADWIAVPLRMLPGSSPSQIFPSTLTT